MEEFFYIGCQVDEVKLIDLLLRRYHSLDFMSRMSVDRFCQLIIVAIDGENKDKHRQEWLALIPIMVLRGKYMSFNEYLDKVTGKNIDMRPADEILREIDEAFEKVNTEGRDGSRNF